MAKRPIHCAWCNKLVYIETRHINRQRAMGFFLYCGRKCSGFGRRKGKTIEEKRAEKAAYDREYRAANLATIKARKRAYFKATYDPEKARIERAANMAWHVEYCRQPAYKVKKDGVILRDITTGENNAALFSRNWNPAGQSVNRLDIGFDYSDLPTDSLNLNGAREFTITPNIGANTAANKILTFLALSYGDLD